MVAGSDVVKGRELKFPNQEDIVQPLENHFCELTRSSWMLFHEGPEKPHFGMSYFDTIAEADEAWAGLRKAFKKLPESYEETVMADKDWKEAYKEHLKPWDHGRLHWVPAWMRGKHAVPADAAVIWFDAGLAFGTGDHPTTRLCPHRLLDFPESHPAAKVPVPHPGCRPGRLAPGASSPTRPCSVPAAGQATMRCAPTHPPCRVRWDLWVRMLHRRVYQSTDR